MVPNILKKLQKSGLMSEKKHEIQGLQVYFSDHTPT